MAGYSEMLDDFRNANVTFSMLIYPYGRCMVISPPLQKNLGQFKPNHLYVGFNNTYFNQLNFSSVKLKIFLMDHQNSPKLIPDDMEMVGDQIRIGLERKAFSYRTKISRSEHVTSDPLFDCAVYTQDNSYDDCIRNHLEELFRKQLGCQPPPFADNFDNMCNQRFNVSGNKSWEIDKMFQHLFYKDWRTGCKIPCTKSKYTTRFSSGIPYPITQISIVFDQTIGVSRSRFSINGHTFLTKLGGLIGVGRTLLWILVSLLGAAQVI